MEIDLHTALKIADIQKRLLELELQPEVVEGILQDTASLVEADAAMAAWLNEGTPLLTTWNTGPQIEEYFYRTFAGVDRDGNIRSTDPDLDNINLTRRQIGSGVYRESAFASREIIEHAAFHREAFYPAGMNYVVGMTKRLAVGEAVFAMGYCSDKALAITGEKTETVLNLLLPAFASAFASLDHQARTQERLQHAIAESDMDIRLTDNEPGSSEVGRAFLNLPLPDPDAGYISISPPDAAILAKRLANTFGLTKRQEVMARCLLDGLSTKEAAARMKISVNTARRHCEAVLARTGSRRRSALNRLARSITSSLPK